MSKLLSSIDVYNERTAQIVDIDVLQKYVCPLCNYFLHDPVQVLSCTCGQRFCRTCFKNSNKCPEKDCPPFKKDTTEMRADKGCSRDMESYKAKCRTCGGEDTLEKIKYHQCTLKCDYCQAQTTLTGMATHLEENCTEYLMSCPWKPNGCAFESKRLSMIEHINKNHSIQQLELLLRLQSQVDILSAKLRISSGLEASTVQQSLTNMCQLLDKADPMDASLGQTSVQSEEILKGGKDTEKEVWSSSSELQTRQEGFSQQLAELTSKVEELGHTAQRQDTVLKDLSLKCEILQVRTTNGVFVWRVSDIKRRYKEAQDGITYSLFSPPFLTSPHGYRLCLRMYLNGDGEGKGTHVSLFMVLMKGEHDSILTWPFNQKVILSLINQTSPNLTKSEAFLPDKFSSSFQRPLHEFNVAIGFPKFVPQSYINDSGFCRDDCFFVKAKVDCTGLSND